VKGTFGPLNIEELSYCWLEYVTGPAVKRLEFAIAGTWGRWLLSYLEEQVRWIGFESGHNRWLTPAALESMASETLNGCSIASVDRSYSRQANRSTVASVVKGALQAGKPRANPAQ
jgi:hypothetical protein